MRGVEIMFRTATLLAGRREGDRPIVYSAMSNITFPADSPVAAMGGQSLIVSPRGEVAGRGTRRSKRGPPRSPPPRYPLEVVAPPASPSTGRSCRWTGSSAGRTAPDRRGHEEDAGPAKPLALPVRLDQGQFHPTSDLQPAAKGPHPAPQQACSHGPRHSPGPHCRAGQPRCSTASSPTRSTPLLSTNLYARAICAAAIRPADAGLAGGRRGRGDPRRLCRDSPGRWPLLHPRLHAGHRPRGDRRHPGPVPAVLDAAGMTLTVRIGTAAGSDGAPGARATRPAPALLRHLLGTGRDRRRGPVRRRALSCGTAGYGAAADNVLDTWRWSAPTAGCCAPARRPLPRRQACTRTAPTSRGSSFTTAAPSVSRPRPRSGSSSARPTPGLSHGHSLTRPAPRPPYQPSGAAARRGACLRTRRRGAWRPARTSTTILRRLRQHGLARPARAASRASRPARGWCSQGNSWCPPAATRSISAPRRPWRPTWTSAPPCWRTRGQEIPNSIPMGVHAHTSTT